jgi:orotidine-5'-phosphate decarboxylase
MMLAAREILDQQSGSKPLLIAVTVLTSMEQSDLLGVGVAYAIDNQVERLAGLAHYCGLDGIVCSAREAEQMRKQFDEKFCLVTPGIRLADSPADDQRRTLTPVQAMQEGSNYLVIGRPITGAENPAQACEKIFNELVKNGFDG